MNNPSVISVKNLSSLFYTKIFLSSRQDLLLPSVDMETEKNKSLTLFAEIQFTLLNSTKILHQENTFVR